MSTTSIRACARPNVISARQHLVSRFAGIATVVLLGTPLITALPAHAADDVTINLIGFNDFHGRRPGQDLR